MCHNRPVLEHRPLYHNPLTYEEMNASSQEAQIEDISDADFADETADKNDDSEDILCEHCQPVIRKGLIACLACGQQSMGMHKHWTFNLGLC